MITSQAIKSLPLIWYLSFFPLSMGKVMILERRCTDRALKLRTALESQLSGGLSTSDMWDRTVSFFAVKKALIFHNGYNKSSREALRLFPSAADDVLPLCWHEENSERLFPQHGSVWKPHHVRKSLSSPTEADWTGDEVASVITEADCVCSIFLCLKGKYCMLMHTVLGMSVWQHSVCLVGL